MGKTHRGRGIRSLPLHGCGVCFRCGATGIKILYETEIDGVQRKICKFCNAALQNIARKTNKSAKSATPVATSEQKEAVANA